MKNFRFGTGISSYQVEGDRLGRSSCIWDDFSHKRGNIKDQSTGDTAIDFVHRYHDDLLLAKELGIQDFRFSLSWARLLKDDGSVNERGVQFYSNLIEEILSLSMNPVVTIFHWDMPSIFMKEKGFISRSIVSNFERYVRLIAERFYKVKDWITFNEPQCFLGIGYQKRSQAPGIDCSFSEMCAGVHNILLCHSVSYRILKEKNPSCNVSFVNTFNVPLPYKNVSKEETFKRENLLFSTPKTKEDFYSLSIYSDPLFLGEYPKEYRELPEVKRVILPGDMERIREAKPDYLCLNIYTGQYYGLDQCGKLIPINVIKKEEMTDLPWLLKRKESIYWGCRFAYERYRVPIIITENGACYHDTLESGAIHDKERSAFIKEYFSEIQHCLKEGIDIRGYYYWSLFDNFEWEWGLSKRFGLVYIDYSNHLKRIKKDSFYVYQDIIAKENN